MKHEIGFMQGRLSPLVNNKIQAFPWEHWKSEFPAAVEIGLHLMEWTLDQENLYKNPLMTDEGQIEIKMLCEKFNFKISSLTGDCFMQAPFYKKTGSERASLIEDFKAIINSCSKIGIEYIVFPLVDAGRLENREQEDDVIEVLLGLASHLKEKKVKVIFESDYVPKELKRFIERLPQDLFGINYDSGNSAALGFDPDEELATYGSRIYNVHIKDRKFQGTTVPLTTGDTQFAKVFKGLKVAGFQGRFILQTARAQDDQHQAVLKKYRDFTSDWIQREFKS